VNCQNAYRRLLRNTEEKMGLVSKYEKEGAVCCETEKILDSDVYSYLIVG
jgi:hypothetical protein